MHTIAILGAGDLGATLAYRLAALEACRRVVLVDQDVGKAKGKALDILQSAPVGGFDTRVEGAAEVAALGSAEAWVVADPLQPSTNTSTLGLVEAVLPVLGGGVLLAAGLDAYALVEAAARAGVPRSRVLGSSPAAFAGALRLRLAAELGANAAGIALTLLGDPPGQAVVPQGSATLAGVPIERLSATALGHAVGSSRQRVPGPLALAAAAARVLRALMGPCGSVSNVVAMLDGEYGQRGIALAVPARLGEGRIGSVLEFALDPVDRVALDSAAQRRHEAG